MIHVTPHSPLVTETDVARFWNENPGCCPHCAAPLGKEHRSSRGVECWVYRLRRNMRHGWIAGLHVRGRSGHYAPDMSAAMLAERDELIHQLRDHGDYDRNGLIEWIAHRKADFDEVRAA